MLKRILSLIIIIALLGLSESVKSQDVVDASTMNNKIMAGYQGWFGAPGDGSGYGWIHWTGGATPQADNISFDMWPDMREYDDDELFATNFKYDDLSNAGLYSAYTTKTVERHVKWMKDYGIDGVYVQRFITSALSRQGQRDKVLKNVQSGAEKYGRVFANMYDMSGAKAESGVQDVINDWKHLVDDLQILESPNYLHHDGKPVLAIWGLNVGGSQGVITATMYNELLQWLTVDAPEKYRVVIMGGVGNSWKTDGPEWQAVYEKCVIVSPWAVGRYRDNSSADGFRESRIEPELAFAENKGLEFMPVVFPGFSWANLYEGKELNQIPRRGGEFLWHQFYNAIDAGCNMVYVAMFDEVDEGTAIFKLAENESQTPTTGDFVTLDMDGIELPSDWYLRLTGEATKMLRGDIPLTDQIPIVAFPDNAQMQSQEVPTNLAPATTSIVTVTIKNTGTTSWTKADGYKLGDPNQNSEWGIDVIELGDGEIIAPNETKTFSIEITTPATEGVYKFQLKMMKGTEWFGKPTKVRNINVTSNTIYFDDCDDKTGWNSSSTLVQNTDAKKQGAGSLEFIGGTNSKVEFSKVLSTPYNSGISMYAAVLRFWYFVSDASLLGEDNEIELGSGGASDIDEYSWTLSNLSSGWNLITLKVSEADVSGTPDLNALDWFRVYNTKTAEITTRIDEIQILDMFLGHDLYTLTINGGTGSGTYAQDAIIEISAGDAPAGQIFTGWEVISGNVLFGSAVDETTSVRILNEDVELTARYKILGKYYDDCDLLTGWGSSSTLSLNETDKKEGFACVEFNGSGTDEFKKAFTTPFNSGVSAENAVLQFWYYVSDASLFSGSNQVEIGSAGRPDEDEYNWNIGTLVDGWNFISLKITEASKMGNPDLNALNWIRIYHFKSGNMTTRIDAIEIIDENAGEKLALGVTDGSGDGVYYAGSVVTISADPNPVGKVFDKWIIESGNPVIADVDMATTTLTTGDESSVVAATFKDTPKYTLTVNNGSGSGEYLSGTNVVIEADTPPAGKLFDKWVIESGTATVFNLFFASTTLTMPLEDVEISATYKDDPNSGIHTPQNQQFVNIYPNPLNQDLLSIDLSGFDATNAIDITITTVLGQVVYKQNVELRRNIEIDTSSFPKSNIYIIDIKSGQFVSTTRLIVE